MQHQTILDQQPYPYPLGKIVCVGRNYADHARELNNPVPSEPILFLKPASAAVDMSQAFAIPTDKGSCHFETEMALLIGQPLTQCSETQAQEAIVGIGLGFDLTLRDLQSALKQKGHPWEKAKAFDGSCPLSEFVSPTGIDWQNVQLRMLRNGQLQQDGNSRDMITPVLALVSYISRYFSLQPGDIVMTGTPAGVGPLAPGDKIEAELVDIVRVTTQVKA